MSPRLLFRMHLAVWSRHRPLPANAISGMWERRRPESQRYLGRALRRPGATPVAPPALVATAAPRAGVSLGCVPPAGTQCSGIEPRSVTPNDSGI